MIFSAIQFPSVRIRKIAVTKRGKEAIKHVDVFLLRWRLSKGAVAVRACGVNQRMESFVTENQDMRAATESYSGFLVMFKWGAIIAALTAALVVLIIA